MEEIRLFFKLTERKAIKGQWKSSINTRLEFQIYYKSICNFFYQFLTERKKIKLYCGKEIGTWNILNS